MKNSTKIEEKNTLEEVENQNPNDRDEKSKEQDNEDVKEVENESNAFQRKKRKKTYVVWEDFELIKLQMAYKKLSISIVCLNFHIN